MKLLNIHTHGVILTLLALVACTPTQEQGCETPPIKTANQEEQTASQPVSTQPASCTLVETGFGAQGQVNVRVEEVVTGLDVPWGIAFLPNRDMLVSERAGRVRLVQNNQLRPQVVATINVSDRGEGGLLGIAAYPDFASNRFFYVYFTANANGSPVNRVERWQLSQEGTSATRDRTIVDTALLDLIAPLDTSKALF